MPRLFLNITLLLFLILGLSWALPSFAGNPSYMNPATGHPIVWNASTAIPYKVDQGNLGIWDNATVKKVIQIALSQWSSVEGSPLKFRDSGSLSKNYTSQNYEELKPYYIRFQQTSRELVFVLDEDGSIFRNMGGTEYMRSAMGATALNGISGNTKSPGYRTRVTIYINGYFWRQDHPGADKLFTLDGLAAVLTHEIGHALGLDHAITHQREFVSGQFHRVASMFPYTDASSGCAAHLVSLQPDDKATLLWLYGGQTVQFIRGQIFKPNGQPQTSAVVTVRNVNSPRCQTYEQVTQTACALRGSSASDPLFTSYECLDPAARGEFIIPVLGDGPFVLDVKNYDTYYFGHEAIQGSLSVTNGIASQSQLEGSPEFWNASDAAEDPTTYSFIESDESQSLTVRLAKEFPDIEFLFGLESWLESDLDRQDIADVNCNEDILISVTEILQIDDPYAKACTIQTDDIQIVPQIDPTQLPEGIAVGDSAQSDTTSQGLQSSPAACSLTLNTNKPSSPWPILMLLWSFSGLYLLLRRANA